MNFLSYTDFINEISTSDEPYFPVDYFHPNDELIYEFFEEGTPKFSMDDLVVATDRDGDQYLYRVLLHNERRENFKLKPPRSHDQKDWSNIHNNIKFYNVPFKIAGQKSWGSKDSEWFYLPKVEADKILHKVRGHLHGKQFGI